MTYFAKYYARIPSLSGQTYQVTLLKNNWIGTAAEIKQYALDALKLNYINDGNKENVSPIMGSNCDFSFYAKSGDTANFGTPNFADTGFTSPLGSLGVWQSANSATGSTGAPWTWQPGNYAQAQSPTASDTQVLYQTNPLGGLWQNGTYSFTVVATNNSTYSSVPQWGCAQVASNDGLNWDVIGFTNPAFTADTIQRTFTYTAHALFGPYKYLGVYFAKEGPSTGAHANFNLLSLTLNSAPASTVQIDYDTDLFSSDYKDWQLAIDKTYFNVPSGKSISFIQSTGITQQGLGANWTNVSGLKQTVISGSSNVMNCLSTLSTNAISGAYTVNWNSSARVDSLTNGVTRSGTVNTNLSGNMPLTVVKTSHTGKAEAPVSIIYSLSGVTVHTTNYVSGNTVSDSYTFFSASTLSNLKVSITETLPANLISGSTTVTGNGGNTAPVGLTGTIIGSVSFNPIFAGSTTPITITPVSSFAANQTTLTLILSGGHAVTTSTNTLSLKDFTTHTTYTPTVTGSGTNTVTITFTVPALSGHQFGLSGAYTFNGL
jgi:hypothetical protein